MASAAATASASATASVATRSRVSPSRARRRVASRPSSASPSRKSVVASAISGPPRSSGGSPPPAALVVGHDAEETRATADVVSRALGVRVVCLLHDETEATSRGGLCPSGSRLKCEPGPFPGSWRLVGGSAEDAAVCGADPTAGLVTSLGFACVLCVVGIAREPCLGEDAAGAKTTRAGKRTAVVSGVPTIVACVPTTSRDAPVDGARDALEKVLQTMRLNDVFSREVPSNSPRSHFPFPTKDRWASLGTRAFPWPDEDMALSFMSDARDASDFAAKDCWSLGNSAEFSVMTRASTTYDYDARSLRRSLREAFRDGDVFVCVSAPPKWSKEKTRGFAACRPGVLWRQERVAAEFGPPGSFRSDDASDDDRDRNRNDAFGRTLPLNALGDSRGCAGSGTGDARFVRQLATERAIKIAENVKGGARFVSSDERYVASPDDDDVRRERDRAPPRGSAPSFFVVGGGVVVADECAGGDVDAVFRKGGGKAAVTTHQTWPAGHPFATTQDAQLEAMRPCGETGLPLWLAEKDE